MKYLLFKLCLLFLLSSCYLDKKDNKFSTITPPKAVPKPISLRLIGTVHFRRSFSELQFIEDEEKQHRYFQRQEKSNPVLMEPFQTDLKKRLIEIGLIKGNELLLKKFRYKDNPNCQFIDSKRNKIEVQFDFIHGRIGEHKIKAFHKGDSSELKIESGMLELKYDLADVVVGGNKEIIVLSEYHIANGDNFDFIVYEVQTN